MAIFRDPFDTSTIGLSAADTYLRVTGNTGPTVYTVGGGRLTFGTTSTALALLQGANAPATADQFAGVRVAPQGPAAASLGVVVRATASSDGKAYTGYIARVTPTSFAIRRNDPALSTITLADFPITQTPGDNIGLKVEGATLTGYYNGAQVMQVTDATYATGSTGIVAAGTANVVCDDFESGSVADLPATGYGTATPPPPPPGQVAGLSVGVVSETTATLSWTATATATSYLPEYRQGATGAWTAAPPVTTTTVTLSGLSSAKGYEVRVTARNAGGSGPASGTASLTTSAPPAPPSTPPGKVAGVTASPAGTTSLSVSWTATATAADYLVEWRAGTSGAWTAGPVVTATTATVTGLTAATSYQVQVTARNAAGAGAPSDPAPATTDSPASGGVVERGYRGRATNLAGEILYTGEPLHVLRWSFYGADGPPALPVWLTATGNVTQKQAEGGYLALRSESATPATLTFTPGVATTDVRGVRVDVDHFRWSGSNPAGAFAITAGTATAGARLTQDGGTFSKLRVAAKAEDTLRTQQGASAAGRRRVSLSVNHVTKEAWQEDDTQVTGYIDGATVWQDGPAPITISVTAPAAAELRLARVTITLYL